MRSLKGMLWIFAAMGAVAVSLIAFAAQGSPAVTNEPLARDGEERKILETLDDLDRNQRRGNMIVPKEDGRVLRLLAEATGARNVVEIGTSTGCSGIWLALALVRPGGLIVAHNMARPDPDPRYIEAVTTNPALETMFIHMDAQGIGITLKKR